MVKKLKFNSDFEEFEQEARGLHKCTVRKTPIDERKDLLEKFKNSEIQNGDLMLVLTCRSTGDQCIRWIKFMSYHPGLDIWKISWW